MTVSAGSPNKQAGAGRSHNVGHQRLIFIHPKYYGVPKWNLRLFFNTKIFSKLRNSFSVIKFQVLTLEIGTILSNY